MREITKSFADKCSYHFMTLKNLIKVVIVSNALFKYNSISLSVNIGSNNDPIDISGLSHLLEHMLFMGSEKYPGENTFGEFISDNSGSYNGHTSDEMTVFTCYIASDKVTELADIFSNFFIAPIIEEESVVKELKVVNAEHLDNLNTFDFIKRNIIALFTRIDDQRGKFITGNAKTLDIENIRNKIFDHWKNNYSSDGMCLVISGNQSIKELKKTAKYFEKIENRNLQNSEKPIEDKDYCLYDEENCGKIIKIKGNDGIKKLLIHIYTQPDIISFKKQGYKFLKRVLEGVEKESIYYELKSKDLIYNFLFDYKMLKDFTEVEMTFYLTQKGFDEYKTILDQIVEYFSRINPDHYEYLRMKKIDSEYFEYKEIGEQINFTEKIAQNLQLYPVENILNHDFVYDEFDIRHIKNIIEQISNSKNWIILIVDDSGSFTQVEEHYNTEYAVLGKFENKNSLESTSNLSLSVLKCTDFENEAKRRGDFYLKRFKVIRKKEPRIHKIESFENGKIVYLFDQKFNVPKSCISINLINEEITTLYPLYEMYLNQTISRFNGRFCRVMENLNVFYTAKVEIDRISLKFEGFSEYLLSICDYFIRELSNNTLVEIEKQKEQATYEYLAELLKEPHNRLKSLYIAALYNLDTEEKRLEIFNSFVESEVKIFPYFYTEIVVVGNIEYESVKAFYKRIENKASNKKTTEIFKIKEIEFTSQDISSNCVGVCYLINNLINKSQSKTESDAFEGREYVTSLKLRIIGYLFTLIYKEKFYNELINKSQYGYVAGMCVIDFRGSCSILFAVQSTRDIPSIKSRIFSFVESLKIHIKEMSLSEFENYKRNCFSIFKAGYLNLRDYSEAIESEFSCGCSDFNFDQAKASILSSILQEDMVQALSVFENPTIIYSKAKS